MFLRLEECKKKKNWEKWELRFGGPNVIPDKSVHGG